MKTFSLLRSCPSTLVCATMLLCVPRIPAADQRPRPSTSTDSKAGDYDLQIVEGKIIRPGSEIEASLQNVVDVLREHYPEANIILAPGLGKISIGDLKLRAGRLAVELEGIRVASGDRFVVDWPQGPNPPQIDPNTGLPRPAPENSNSGLFVLREIKGPESRRAVEAFNIGPYLEWLHHQDATNKLKEADYLGPIESMISDTLLAYTGDSPVVNQPAFQYHPGANLLVVIGTMDSIEVARKIVSALPGMNPNTAVAGPAFYPQPGRTPDATDHAAQDRARAEAAFRARYGLRPAKDNMNGPQPDSAPFTPEPGPPK